VSNAKLAILRVTVEVRGDERTTRDDAVTALACILERVTRQL